MKARLVDSMPSGGGWIYEIKFDGHRAIALRGGKETRVLSRNEKDSSGFPGWAAQQTDSCVRISKVGCNE